MEVRKIVGNKIKYYRLIIIFLFVVIFLSLYTVNYNSKIRYKQHKTFTVYIVKQGDCLIKIAENYDSWDKYNLIEEIKYYNNIGEAIFPGEQLKIPVEVP
jgi:LysM repeat protein